LKPLNGEWSDSRRWLIKDVFLAVSFASSLACDEAKERFRTIVKENILKRTENHLAIRANEVLQANIILEVSQSRRQVVFLRVQREST
jgi:hypothetical protein